MLEKIKHNGGVSSEELKYQDILELKSEVKEVAERLNSLEKGDHVMDIKLELKKLKEKQESIEKENYHNTTKLDRQETDMKEFKEIQGSIEKENYKICTRLDREQTDLKELKENMCIHSKELNELKELRNSLHNDKSVSDFNLDLE